MKTLTELVKERAHFDHYRDGSLFYRTDSGFAFEVPVADAGAATFHATDRAILFMRWIRPALAQRASWQKMIVDGSDCSVV